MRDEQAQDRRARMKYQRTNRNRQLLKLISPITQGIAFGLAISVCTLFCAPMMLFGTTEIMATMSFAESLYTMAVFIGIFSFLLSVTIFAMAGKFRSHKPKPKETSLSSESSISAPIRYLLTDDGEVLEVIEDESQQDSRSYP
jgi:hypothetical protein